MTLSELNPLDGFAMSDGFIRGNLQRLIDEKGWSRRELARQMCVDGLQRPSASRVNDMFTGRRGSVTWKEVCDLSQALGCTVFDIVLPPRGAPIRDLFADTYFGITTDRIDDATEATQAERSDAIPFAIALLCIEQHPDIADQIATQNRLADLRESFSAEDSQEYQKAISSIVNVIDYLRKSIQRRIETGELPDPAEVMNGLLPEPPLDFETLDRLYDDEHWTRRVREHWNELDPRRDES